MDQPLDIAHVVRRTGLTARALRFYEGHAVANSGLPDRGLALLQGGRRYTRQTAMALDKTVVLSV